MKVTKIESNRIQRKLFWILVLLTLSSATLCASSSKKSSSKSKSKSSASVCIVDKCALCPSKKTILCQACKPGWYLRTFTSGEKTYNACWSISKLILALLGMLLLSLLLCGICAICYTLGKKALTRMPMAYPDMPLEDMSYRSPPREITKPRVIYEEPIVQMSTTPRMVRREPEYEYEAPRVIRRAAPQQIYSSPISSSRVMAPPMASSGVYRSPINRSNGGVVIRPGRIIR